MSDPTAIPLDVDPRAQRIRATTAHDDLDFDIPFVSQITDTLWVGGCANGLVLPTTFEHVISLYPWEAYLQTHELKSFLAVRMYDSESQAFDRVAAIASWVNNCRAGGVTLVHCQAGLNRSNLIAGAALIQGGMEPAAAIALLREKRDPAVLCNHAFEQWLLGLPSLHTLPLSPLA